MPYVNKSWSLNKFNDLKKEINSARKEHNNTSQARIAHQHPLAIL